MNDTTTEKNSIYFWHGYSGAAIEGMKDVLETQVYDQETKLKLISIALKSIGDKYKTVQFF